MSWADRLFGRAGRKALGGSIGWTIGSVGDGDLAPGYEARVRAVQRNPVAHRAVKLVAEGLASVPITHAGQPHPAVGLVSPTVLETLATHLLLHGNAFAQTGIGLDGAPTELWPLRPERMRLEADADGWPRAWIYRAGDKVERFPAQGDVGAPGLLHLKALDPLHDTLGHGCLDAAADGLALLEAAGRWNRRLLANAARPSGALVLDPSEGSLSAEQFQRLKTEIEDAFQGAENAGRPMLLEGGLSWQPLALSPAEMDFQRAREAAARDVALAFGVPPMLLGLPGDSTHANYAEANVALWRLTILPLLTRMLDGLSRHLGLWWPDLRLEPDLDLVPALWADRERLWRHVGDADFLSRTEKREMLGWAAEPEEGQ